jgi:hypothetical protein
MKGDAAASPESVEATESALGLLPAFPYPPLSPGSFYGGGKRGAIFAVGSERITLNLGGKWSS